MLEMKRSPWRSALLLALADVALTVCAQAPGAPPTITMRAFKDGRPVNVERRTVRVVVTTPNGREVPAHVVMIREPESGLYWWMFQRVPATLPVDGIDDVPLPYVLQFSGDRGVGFGFATPFLFVRDVQGGKPDFAAIQQATVEQIQRSARGIQDGTVEWDREINLVTSGADRAFFSLEGSASAYPQPSITAVNRTTGRWDVTLEGPNHDFLRVSLDDQYRLLNVRREPAAR